MTVCDFVCLLKKRWLWYFRRKITNFSVTRMMHNILYEMQYKNGRKNILENEVVPLYLVVCEKKINI